ncbi:MAG: formyltetrahydrofolate deformylase [Verrucomicrobia bacterium]|nr:formyltetrahydrofolate deformylase [Pseudomonadota bacterium]NBS05968.1 formyltetrahydrofolate deformylase [Verrucomicrobiota bacterium]NBS78412.1 formyltetrahydrofolate deformylase [bacterium]NBS50053.1 formyltetrahydrofolate deformylase [Verrucomicrobiota bacterium]NBT23131.1 formyltetrahydrofolate deformylase [bacterium]
MANRSFVTIGLVGPDRTGAIAAVTQQLFRMGANIESLEEQVARGKFRMTLLASWPGAKLEEKKIRTQLISLARQLRMNLTLRLSDATRARKRLAILVSKETHAAEAILRAWKSRALAAEPVLVAGNHPQLHSLARRYRLPFALIPYRDRAKAEASLQSHLEKASVDLVVLARFMKILSPDFVWPWKNRILNIHPSLLPSFPGASAYRQAYDKGVKIVGVTAHFVTPDLDQGPILCQDALRLRPNESLPSIIARGQKLEASCLLRALKLCLSRQLDVHWGRVHGV